ncbi:MAG: tRNA uridine-5-carboxymethylaminomethyl(34) synthesis GTPase MnmE [Xanthobacteraceae bacterium]|nr:MAG: tRNA uridine-5-carboxymethylaminomethyl(34) synthesis GTPase MnmE [Xanthobacteraceae bacterium]
MIDKSTIFALSSGRPPAGVAVIRISGPRAGAALEALGGGRPQARRAHLAMLRSAGGEAIDEALVLWFPAPHSATGEDVAELQLHGGRAVIAAALAALGEVAGCRPAEPGEFTRRAFENGRIDLTAAEGLHDLIFAETEMQRRQGLAQLKGLLGHKAVDWRAQLIAASALIEAGIDFSDEGDIPAELMAPALDTIAALHGEIAALLAGPSRAERLRDGLVVAIVGPPNAGKSTLLNRLARREAAIVSPHAGTTRDVIEVHLDLAGYPVTLLDTAGIRMTDDPVEQEGVRRAEARAAAADLVLWLVDASAPRAKASPPVGGAPVWTVRTKTDLVAGSLTQGQTGQGGFAIAAGEESGLERLVAALAGAAQEFLGGTESGIISRARHRLLLQETAGALAAALAAGDKDEEIVAEEIRIAVRSLGKLLGKIDIEDVLDRIFSEFCIGK